MKINYPKNDESLSINADVFCFIFVFSVSFCRIFLFYRLEYLLTVTNIDIFNVCTMLAFLLGKSTSSRDELAPEIMLRSFPRQHVPLCRWGRDGGVTHPCNVCASIPERQLSQIQFHSIPTTDLDHPSDVLLNVLLYNGHAKLFILQTNPNYHRILNCLISCFIAIYQIGTFFWFFEAFG